MKKVIWSSALMILLVSGAALAADAAKGKELFTTHKCTLCHSAEGKGNAKGNLDGVGAKLSAAEIKQWLVDPEEMTAKTKATRKPAMKNKAYPAADVDDMVAYLATLKKK